MINENGGNIEIVVTASYCIINMRNIYFLLVSSRLISLTISSLGQVSRLQLISQTPDLIVGHG